MRGGLGSNGYTIVEVMIFLAVSGLMFVMAANLVNGQQAKTQFKQGMNDFNSIVERTITSLSNGNYSQSGNIKCAVVGDVPTVQLDASASADQGNRKGCVYSGNILQFNADNDETKYRLLPIVSRQFQGTSQTLPPANFFQMNSQASSALAQVNDVPWNLRVYKVVDTSDSNRNTRAIGFFSTPANYSGATLQSGSQSMFALPVYASGPGVTEVQAAITNLASSSPLDAAATTVHSYKICVTDDTRYADITIGGDSSQQLATRINYYSSKPTGAAPCA